MPPLRSYVTLGNYPRELATEGCLQEAPTWTEEVSHSVPAEELNGVASSQHISGLCWTHALCLWKSLCIVACLTGHYPHYRWMNQEWSLYPNWTNKLFFPRGLNTGYQLVVGLITIAWCICMGMLRNPVYRGTQTWWLKRSQGDKVTCCLYC